MNPHHGPETKRAVQAAFPHANLPPRPPPEERPTGTMEVLLLDTAVDMLPWAGWTKAAWGRQPAPLKGALLQGEPR